MKLKARHMALFKKEKTKDTQEKEVAQTSRQESAPEVQQVGHGMFWVLQKPHITEKTTDLSMQNAYVFDVHPKANKKQVMEAVREVYDVTPVKVRTIAVPYKRIRTRKGTGVRGGGKKAIVFLKEGEKIEFI